METKHIPDFERYESKISHITQRKIDWCIPANIESVTKYFESNSPVTQEYLWDKWVKACRQSGEQPERISFRGIKTGVLDNDENYLYFESKVEVVDMATLALSMIPSLLDRGPVIISLPAVLPRKWHVYTAVGCSRLGDLHLHDTGRGILAWRNLAEIQRGLQDRNQTKTDILIIRLK